MSARETALCCLIACRQEGAWSNGVLKAAISRHRLDPRDAALATRLCYGVVQNRLKLDYYLAQLLTSRKKLHPVLRDILHLGMYQLLEMDRVPDRAAVNESVALCRKYCKDPNAPGLCNAVLRRAAQEKATLQAPTGYAEKYSHPDALITLLKQNLPKGTLEGMLIADNEAPATVVQVNTTKTTPGELCTMLEAQGVSCHVHSKWEGCVVLERTGNLENLDAFRQGLFYVQDPASRLAVRCAGLPRSGAQVMDCCAAPGGKSFAAALAMAGQGSIVSCDVYPHKAELIAAGAARLGFDNLTARVQDAAEFVPDWKENFDCVLVDAPCSGLGIIRKKPDIRYKNLEEIKTLPELQWKILNNQANYVRPGGVLMYSTCTVLKRENEEVVKSFLENHPDFFLTPLRLPDFMPENTTGMLTLIPGQYDTDGFFISRMERKL